jgi:hypothetical protein
MGSTLGIARCELALRGVHYDLGDIRETFASIAVQRRQNIHFLTTLSIISAIMQVGRTVAEAVGGSAGGGQKDLLSKNLDALTAAIFPYLEEDTQKRAVEVRKQLEIECNRGPMKVQVMQESSKARGKVRIGGGAKHDDSR